MYTISENSEQVFSPVDGDLSLQTRFGNDHEGLGLITYTISPTSIYSQHDGSYQSPSSPWFKSHSLYQSQKPYHSKSPYGSQDQTSQQSSISPSSARRMSIPRKPIPGDYERIPEPQHPHSFDEMKKAMNSSERQNIYCATEGDRYARRQNPHQQHSVDAARTNKPPRRPKRESTYEPIYEPSRESCRKPEPRRQETYGSVQTKSSRHLCRGSTYGDNGRGRLPEPHHQDSFDTVQTKTSKYNPRRQSTYDSVNDFRSQSYLSYQQSFDAPTHDRHGSFDTIEEEKEEASALPVKRGWRFYGTFACLACVTLVCAIDATILSVALPTIATSLKGTTAIEAFWTGTSFLLCSTVFQPTWASFSHIIGRKSVLLTALFFFTAGTVICSIANKIAVLLAGRCVQGIGGGGLVALTYVIVADMVPLRERGKWFSIISLQWAIGTVIGPVIGGTFSEKASWRWIFWLNIPFCVIAFIGIPICLRLHIKPGDISEKLRAFDWFGSIIFVGATTSFLIPLTWGGIMYEWTSWRTLVPLVVGVVGLVVFIIYSVYFSSEPLVRRSLFNTPTAISAYFGTLIQGNIVWALLYYMPLYFEVAKGYSPINSGIAIFPFTFTTAPAAVVTGLIITKTGRYRPSLWVGWFLTTLGMGLLIYLKQNTSTPSWICLSLVGGCGMGILFSAMGFAAQSSVSNPDLPFAGAMYSFFRAFGQTIGVAISGTIFQNTFKKKILATAYSPFADEWSNDAAAFVQVVKNWSTVGEEGIRKQVVITTYVESLRMVWTVMCILSAAAFLASVFWTAELSMDRELETDQGFVYESEPKKARSPSQVRNPKRAPTWEKERERKPSLTKISSKGTVYNANDVDMLLLARGFGREEV